jgi:hypothetical protein
MKPNVFSCHHFDIGHSIFYIHYFFPAFTSTLEIGHSTFNVVELRETDGSFSRCIGRLRWAAHNQRQKGVGIRFGKPTPTPPRRGFLKQA